MNGFKEDLLNVVAEDIETKWELMQGNLSYFVGKVKDALLKPADLATYLEKHGDKCPESVKNVFSAIVFEDAQTKEEGGAR